MEQFKSYDIILSGNSSKHFREIMKEFIISVQIELFCEISRKFLPKIWDKLLVYLIVCKTFKILLISVRISPKKSPPAASSKNP